MFARRLFFVAAPGYTAMTAAHAAQVTFSCPAPGTLEQRGVSTLKYTGTSAADSFVCARLDPRGKAELRLFNLYALSGTNNTAAANVAARSGMMDLLSGRKTSVSFPYTAFNGYIQQDTWTLLRREPYAIDGKTVEVLVLDHDVASDARGTSGFHGRYTHWLDPKTGIRLKMELSVITGSANFWPQAYRVRSVTLP